MNKISLDEISSVLQEFEIEIAKRQKILEHLQQILEEEKQEKEQNKVPKTKNEFGVILYASDLIGKEYTASVYQIKTGDDHGTVVARISDSVRAQNNATKKKDNLIQSLGGAFQNLKRKFIKDKGVNLKTKETVRVIISNNELL